MSPILMEGEEGGGIISGDCYNRFRHCDGSYEWKLCEVESKIPGQEDFIIKSMHMPDGKQVIYIDIYIYIYI